MTFPLHGRSLQGMSSRTVCIHSSSTEVVFEGNLLKAPPLNRRGRKKWHERYFILRANRTLECHKSKKSQKSPRRVVDLRECINLEVGLEYKNLQHVMSLGTFKRTFFYAAPSDPLMLQWADVLEKAKNAKDSETIEVLNIGLRRSMETRDDIGIMSPNSSKSPPTSIRSPMSSHSFSMGMRNKIKNGKGMALSHFSHGSTDTVDLRMITSMQNNEFSSDGGLISPTSSCAVFSGDERDVDSICRPRSSSSGHSSATVSSTNSPGHVPRKLSKSSMTSITVSTPIFIPNKVPPPNGMLMQASRDKNGFFVSAKKPVQNENETGEMDNGDAALKGSGLEDSYERENSGEGKKSKEFVPRESSLKRIQVIKGNTSVKSKQKIGFDLPHSPQKGMKRAVPLSTKQGVSLFQSNMKRSFRYRKITLRPEKPLFGDEENSDSEDERDSYYTDSTSCVPGPSCIPGPASPSSVTSSTSVSGPSGVPGPTSPSSVTSPTRISGASQTSLIKNRAITQRDLTKIDNNQPAGGVNYRDNHPSAVGGQNYFTGGSSGHPLANTYSKVIVTGPRRVSTSTFFPPGKRLTRLRSNSESMMYENRDTPSDDVALTNPSVKALSQDDSAFILPPPIFGDDDSDCLLSPSADVFDLIPGRPPSDGFMFGGSQNSLDNIVVDPPEMFVTESTDTTESVEVKSKRKLSRTRRVKKPSKSFDKTLTEVCDDDNNPGSSDSNTGIKDNSKSDVVPDRGSTESSDTGYISSSTSPGYHDDSGNKTKGEKTTEYKLECQEGGESTNSSGCSTPRPDSSSFSNGTRNRAVLKSNSSLMSWNSVSSDTSARFYVPLVFHSTRVEGAGVHQDPNKFSIQVCLVENSEELIKDLISLKSLETYSILDCDEIHGEENVSAEQVDDFTVETSLEDLEFGFSVVKNTQKDLFMRKVRQFTFEVSNLFGSSKPFSCDVEVRHADQLTVLPIEVM